MRDKAVSQHSSSILDALNMGESSNAKVAFDLEKKGKCTNRRTLPSSWTISFSFLRLRDTQGVSAALPAVDFDPQALPVLRRASEAIAGLLGTSPVNQVAQSWALSMVSKFKKC
jgi:hypothetical protein